MCLPAAGVVTRITLVAVEFHATIRTNEADKSDFKAAAFATRGMRYAHTRTQTQQGHREDKQYYNVTKRA
jgi:hypothetical protein